MQQSGVNKGGAESLKGNGGGRAEGVTVFRRGCVRGRLVGIFRCTRDLELG